MLYSSESRSILSGIMILLPFLASLVSCFGPAIRDWVDRVSRGGFGQIVKVSKFYF